MGAAGYDTLQGVTIASQAGAERQCGGVPAVSCPYSMRRRASLMISP
ncbi:hypothetical protein [Kamptonema formosum]|nr:hypothetical protein [Oscillatoria sp. PCC 10802]